MMNVPKLILRRKAAPVKLTSKLLVSHFSTEEKIELPKRIPRGPTDILRALESTVSRDPTAGHYKYHDDPFLIPLSNNGKRVFAMAQEAGRKAAHWIRQEHADLFQHKEADPVIEAFIPQIVYNENSDAHVSDLEKLINTAQVSDAAIVYKLLKGKNVAVSPELEQGLLELLAYQNGEDGASEDFIEERWFKQSNKGREKIRKTWKDGDIADQIFINLKTPEAYCAIIQGMAKYHQVDRALQLFEESQKNNIVLNTNTYNSLISVVNMAKENFDMRWSLIGDLLAQMKNAKLKPNLGTLNAVLFSLSWMGNPMQARQCALKTLSEFKKMSIEPSLASWHFILLTFCKERGPASPILRDIMDHLEDKDHQIRDLKDVNFFVTAMEMCRRHLNDVTLAKRVDKLLHHGDNYNLIGDSYKESVYFRHYFSILCANLPFDEFMNDVYYKLVPHIYVPENGIMEEILTQVDSNSAVEYIPKLWSDMIVFDQIQRENLVTLVLNAMVNSDQQLISLEMSENFANIAWDVHWKCENPEDKRINKLSLTGDLYGKILMLLVRSKDFERACIIMDKLDKDQQNIPGVPKVEALKLFIDLCIEQKAQSRATACMKYCEECGLV